jgi:hypothetical protein
VHHLAEALARGEESRSRIGLTVGRNFIDESTFSASSYGFVKRAGEKVGLAGSEKSDEDRQGDDK